MQVKVVVLYTLYFLLFKIIPETAVKLKATFAKARVTLRFYKCTETKAELKDQLTPYSLYSREKNQL